jgi:hypothetical protein
MSLSSHEVLRQGERARCWANGPSLQQAILLPTQTPLPLEGMEGHDRAHRRRVTIWRETIERTIEKQFEKQLV